MNGRLYRSRRDRMLGGVAAGLATYLNTDPALVRIAWAILVPVTDGVALVAYVVAWIVLPEEPLADAMIAEPRAVQPHGEADASEKALSPSERSPSSTAATPVRTGNAGVIVGVGLVLLGLWFLLGEYLPDLDWGLLWPLALVGIGVLVVSAAMRRRDADR